MSVDCCGSAHCARSATATSACCCRSTCSRSGLSPFEVGVIATGTLLGSGALTLAGRLHAHRFRYRTLLLAATALMAATGLGFAVVTRFWPLLLIAFVGTLNPSSGDVSVFLPLEHAVLSRVVADTQRTAVFARYSLVGALVGAAGALFARLPAMARQLVGISTCIGAAGDVRALRAAWAWPRRSSTASCRPRWPPKPKRRRRRCASRRRIVYTLAALFSLDAFGGGFIVQSMLALWLFEKFQLSIATAGTIFFWTGVLLGLLVPGRGAHRRSHRPVNTMVFTHLPSSVLLVLMPFVPTSAGRSRCCWCAARCRRWTCRRAART